MARHHCHPHVHSLCRLSPVATTTRLFPADRAHSLHASLRLKHPAGARRLPPLHFKWFNCLLFAWIWHVGRTDVRCHHTQSRMNAWRHYGMECSHVSCGSPSVCTVTQWRRRYICTWEINNCDTRVSNAWSVQTVARRRHAHAPQGVNRLPTTGLSDLHIVLGNGYVP